MAGLKQLVVKTGIVGVAIGVVTFVPVGISVGVVIVAV
jgi:hypothetical protein